MAKPVRRQQQRKKNDNGMFDMLSIIKYFALWILFAIISFGIKTVVLSAVNMSPTKQCGNGMLTLYEVHNTGAAFNLFSNQPEMIIVASGITVLVLTFIVLFASAKLSHASISAMAFLSAGITMNMLERISLGYVIDYINCDFLNNFPVFNVPDIMIVVGAIGLILSILFKK